MASCPSRFRAAFLVALLSALLSAAGARAASQAPVRPRKGMVVSVEERVAGRPDYESGALPLSYIGVCDAV